MAINPWKILKSIIVQNDADRSKQLELSVDSSSTTNTKTSLKALQSADISVELPSSSTKIIGRDTTDQGANRLKNKDLEANSIQFVDSADVTKVLKANLAGLTTGVTVEIASAATANRVITLPNASTTLVGTSDSAQLSNKELVDNSVLFVDNADTTKKLAFELSGLTTATTRTLSVPDASTTIVGTDTAQTLSNKTLVDVSTTIQDDADPTKQARFQASSITAGATRVLTLPDANTTLVGTDASQVLSNKSLVDSTTTIEDNADSTKKVRFEVSGVTTGLTRVLTVPDANTTLVGTDASQVLTNKDIDGGTASNTSRLTLPKNTKTNLDGLTRKEATLVYASDQGLVYIDNGSSLLPIGGNWTTYSTQNISAGGSVTLSLVIGLQYRRVQGNGAAVTLSTTPFGTSAPTDGTVVRLIGQSNTNTVTITNNDIAKGALLNGPCVLGAFDVIELQYDSSADRWIEISRNN